MRPNLFKIPLTILVLLGLVLPSFPLNEVQAQVAVAPPPLMITEVYYNVDSRIGITGITEATGTKEWMNEWIELKNIGEEPVDISGWQIADNNATTTIPSSPPIPAGGFAIITPSTSTFDFWPGIPENTVKIVLNERIGNGLANTGDRVILRDKDGNTVDCLSYGNNDSILQLPDVLEGHSLERSPLSFEFFDQEKPTPGKSALDNFWHKEITDPENDTQEGYDIISALVAYDDEEILNLLPLPEIPTPIPVMCKTLIAKIELKEILSSEEYPQYSGVAMKIEREGEIYLLVYEFSTQKSYLFFSQDGGKTWQSIQGNYFGYQYGDEIFFAIKMEDIGSLPWKVEFLSGNVAFSTKYQILDETDSIEIPSEKWSFAIITDLHIGRGYPDYGTESFDDTIDDGDYYLTERLKNVVDWIIDNKDKIDCQTTTCPIKFLAVLGDIADSAEKSEFKKAKEILDKLNDPNGDGDTSDGIPYVPVFGNHDVWPYTEKEEATTSLGENYFDEIFWNENATNTELMKQKLNWQRDEANPNYKNFAFTYGGINFIGLDFVERMRAPGKGTVPWAEIPNETKNWLNDCLSKHKKCLKRYKENFNIIFSHHPFIDGITGISEAFNPIDFIKIKQIIENKKVLANFAGHIHSFEELWGKWPENANKEYDPIDATKVLKTEALMVGSNGRGVERETKENGVVDGKKGIIRIVKVFDKNNIDPYNWETTETGDEFPALNPDFNWYISKTESSGEPLEYTFKARKFSDREVSLYRWNFGDLGEKKGEEVSITRDELSPYIGPFAQFVQLPVELEEIDKSTGYSEKIKKTEKIYLGYGYSLSTQPFIQPISVNTNQDLRLTVENRDGVIVQINEVHSPPKPVGLITVNFNQATSNIDLTNLLAQTDLENRKSVLYMPEWPKVVEESKVLLIPSTGAGKVYICPKATSLEDVNPNCKNKTILSLGETKKGMALSLTEYEGREYYLVYGITGTGGGEAEKKEVRLEEQIAITKMEYDGKDILEKVTKNVGDGKSPLLLSELKEATIDLEDYTQSGKINPGEKKKLKMKFKFLESAGNEYQGKSIKVKFKFKATQEEQ